MRERYTIRVTLLEARALVGTDESRGFAVSPVAKVRLTAGQGPNLVDETKASSTQPQSNSAFWRQEVLVFQHALSREAFTKALRALG